ncbi:hypothetical protein ACQ4M4_19565 [Leptolyngbya sp. AN02str]|uniref:hypothetical protein n=1 Tax=Leptolyngbya sp. AN02str TaxID=3423363 RepID=UPI003D320862
MSEITITGIATKQMSQPDDSGDIYYAIKATVQNNSGRPLEVNISIQAVDEDDFELTDVSLSSEIAADETKTITDKTFMPHSDYVQIAKWQIKSVSTYDV